MMSLLEITLLKSSSPDFNFLRKSSKIRARSAILSKISSVSKNFKKFYDPDYPKYTIVWKNKELGKSYYLGIPILYGIVGLLLISLPYFIPHDYFIYLGIIIIFISFLPPALGTSLGLNSKNRKNPPASMSTIAYLTAKDSSLFLSQVFSLVIMALLIIPSSSNKILLIYPSLIGVTLGILTILVVRRHMRIPAHIIEDWAFKANFKPVEAAIHVKVSTKCEKMQGMLVSIGNYLIIENKMGHRWPVDWDKIIDVVLIKENFKYRT